MSTHRTRQIAQRLFDFFGESGNPGIQTFEFICKYKLKKSELGKELETLAYQYEDKNRDIPSHNED